MAVVTLVSHSGQLGEWMTVVTLVSHSGQLGEWMTVVSVSVAVVN